MISLIMKNLIKSIVVLTLIPFCNLHSQSQDYNNLLALKTGVSYGIMYKKLLPNETAFSAQLTYKDRGVTMNAYRLFHQLAFPDKSYKLFLYYGYGTHFRYYTRYHKSNVYKPFRPSAKYKGNYFAAGLDGIVGLEYRFLKYPFVISSDINPNFEFGGATFFKVNLDLISVNFAYTF